MSNHYNILDHGAVSGGADCTYAIQSAIDTCWQSGGGIVEIPAGEYHTGDIRLRSRVTLYLRSGAVLKGSRDPKEFKKASDALARRGYSWSQISEGLRRYGADVED